MIIIIDRILTIDLVGAGTEINVQLYQLINRKRANFVQQK